MFDLIILHLHQLGRVGACVVFGVCGVVCVVCCVVRGLVWCGVMRVVGMVWCAVCLVF